LVHSFRQNWRMDCKDDAKRPRLNYWHADLYQKKWKSQWKFVCSFLVKEDDNIWIFKRNLIFYCPLTSIK
jgi:hypothetical protein